MSQMPLIFDDAFNEFTDKITKFVSIKCLDSIRYLLMYSVNFIVIFREIAKIANLLLGILIWATLYTFKFNSIHVVLNCGFSELYSLFHCDVSPPACHFYRSLKLSALRP